jgi:hypothetical protein
MTGAVVNESAYDAVAHCASKRCIRRTPVGRGEANKVGVRYTFNCVLWFNHFERQLAASCVGFGVPEAGIRKYLLHFDRKG